MGRYAYRNWIAQDDRPPAPAAPRWYVMTRDRDKSFVHKSYATKEEADTEAERLRAAWKLPDYCCGLVYVVVSNGEE